jgi:hypothetical protein
MRWRGRGASLRDDGIGVLGPFVVVLDSVHIRWCSFDSFALVVNGVGVVLVLACCSFGSLAFYGVGPFMRVVSGARVVVCILLLYLMASALCWRWCVWPIRACY